MIMVRKDVRRGVNQVIINVQKYRVLLQRIAVLLVLVTLAFFAVHKVNVLVDEYILARRGNPPGSDGAVEFINLISSRGGLWGTPTILVLSIFQKSLNSGDLAKYLYAIESLNYPKDHVTLAFLFHDKSSSTYKAFVSQQSRDLRQLYHRVVIVDYDPYEKSSDIDVIDRESYLRNALLNVAIKDEDFILWLDPSVISLPGNIITDLTAKGKPCLSVATINAEGNKAADAYNTIDSRPLHEYDSENELLLDVASPLLLLVSAELYRNGLSFPPFRIKNKRGIEGHSEMIRRMESSCWGLPNYEVKFKQTT